MDIEKSVLYEEVTAIAREGIPDIHYTWRLEILAGEETIEIDKLVSVYTNRDYLNRYTDEIEIEFEARLGDYIYDILPNQSQLVATLFKVPARSKDGDENLEEGSVRTKRYTCILKANGNPTLMASGGDTLTKAEANRKELIRVEAQLISAEVESYRTQEINNIFRDVTVAEVLKTVMMPGIALEGSSVRPATGVQFVAGLHSGIVGVDIVAPTNQKRYDHIIVPPGVRLLDLPAYLQKKYGVYDTGIGFYLQDGIWYIFPQYDTTQFSKVKRKATFANVPSNRFAGSDNTFNFNDGELRVIVTGDVTHNDTTLKDHLNMGNGYRVMPANRVIDTYSKTSKDICKVARTDNMLEVIVEALPTGKNHAPFASDVITNNTFRENSRLASQVGSRLIAIWENSVADHIKPGMPVKFLYQSEGETISLNGVIQGTESNVNVEQGGILNNKFNSTTSVQMFVERDVTD